MTTPEQAASRRAELIVQLLIDTMVMHGIHADPKRQITLPYGEGASWSHVAGVINACVRDLPLLEEIVDGLKERGWSADVYSSNTPGSFCIRIGCWHYVR